MSSKPDAQSGGQDTNDYEDCHFHVVCSNTPLIITPDTSSSNLPSTQEIREAGAHGRRSGFQGSPLLRLEAQSIRSATNPITTNSALNITNQFPYRV